MRLQLTELLTRYGEVKAIWFDGLYRQEKYDRQRFSRSYLQAATSNPGERPDRSHRGLRYSRTVHSEIDSNQRCAYVVERPASKKTSDKEFPPLLTSSSETCMTINKTWANNANDHNYKVSTGFASWPNRSSLINGAQVLCSIAAPRGMLVSIERYHMDQFDQFPSCN
jgi:alpha-L-fucosidase